MFRNVEQESRLLVLLIITIIETFNIKLGVFLWSQLKMHLLWLNLLAYH